ncbi:GGDEF domain-containing protein [Rubrivivax gelatinosus]|uniref:diguanylate cyclase n=1 Tax=Rubrivivax gelatinosus (strain NBRC 100245 / IL144) TaxID=983917 RepID=I0HKU2_RUBGI|nr:GGDEF domain-containing protein [Rubrivivax gelatinosus]BAL93629.1 diguanylate cyclase [Rubrivivax gelatinosus IL144]
MLPSAMRFLGNLLLGRDPDQRLHTLLTLVGWTTCVLMSVAHYAEAVLGLADEANTSWLAVFSTIGALLFYLLMRSGVAPQWVTHARLSWVQASWATVAICWAYALSGPARGAAVLLLVLLPLFGMFSLTPRQTWRMAVAAYLAVALVMAWKAQVEPERYDPRIELLHLVFAGIVLSVSSVLATLIGRLKRQSEQERSKLACALERIEALATHDELTGLTNRRAAGERLRRAAREPGASMCVAMIDLDRFKQVNDSRGHAVGDEVLRHFARVARQTVRAEDMLARWGGEEFLLLMPATTPEQALTVLARLRERLRAAPLACAGAGYTVTFSAGVAPCGGAGEADLDAAIARADDAMYRAKREGRDRTLLQPVAA